MVSPNTITVDLVDINAYLKPSVQEQQAQQQQSSLDELAAFEGDPLEWLIETGVAEDDEKNNSWLPESSLPFFPDLNKDKVVGQPQDPSAMEVEHHNSHPPPLLIAPASETMVEDAISNNMVDPNVTMQSLFLPGEETPAGMM